MKTHIRTIRGFIIAAILLSLSACGGGGAAVSDTSVDVNTLDGASGISLDSVFTYTFANTVVTATVTEETFFFLPTPAAAAQSIGGSKAALDTTVCDPANALAGSISCGSSTQCTLTPAEDLTCETGYTVCLTEGIQYLLGTAFEGFMASFTTVDCPESPVNITSAEIVRLDGTKLALTDRPIPRSLSLLYTLDVALTESSQRDAFEAAVECQDPSGEAVPGTYSWASDGLSVTFTPVGSLDYGTEYTIAVTTASLPLLSVGKQTDGGAMSFTTMARNDVDGDGYADLLVGASNAHFGGAMAGGAYLFLGSGSGITDWDLGSTAADTSIYGEQGCDSFGISVNHAGDVNADGYVDVIMGASAGGATNNGRAYLFLGSASGIADCDLATAPGCTDATLTGEGVSDAFGLSVGAAGDVNGDGYDDIIVGAYNYQDQANPGQYPGRAYVFFGGSGLSGSLGAGSADVIITGDADKDYFGRSAAGAGDVNGDGYDDIIVGANGTSPYYTSIFHGGPGLAGSLTPSANAATTIIGDGNPNDFGNSVNRAGDVNGDGYGDVIIGSQKADNGAITGAGKVYLFLGAAGGIADCDMGTQPGCPDAAFAGAADDDYLGTAVAPAGDINGDGYDDIILGANHDKPGGLGYAYLFTGSSSGMAGCDIASTPSGPAASFAGGAAGDFLGTSLNLAGDVNGDGYDDIVIGARGAEAGKGRAYFFTGSSGGIADCNLATCTATATITGATAGDWLGNGLR